MQIQFPKIPKRTFSHVTLCKNNVAGAVYEGEEKERQRKSARRIEKLSRAFDKTKAPGTLVGHTRNRIIRYYAVYDSRSGKKVFH